MVRRDKNRRTSSNSEAAEGSPRQQTPDASNLRGRNNFFDDFESFYYTGQFADDSSTENNAAMDEPARPEMQVDPYAEAAYRPPTDKTPERSLRTHEEGEEDSRPLRTEEQASVPGIRRVVIPPVVEPYIEDEVEEELQTAAPFEPAIEAAAQTSEMLEAELVEETKVVEAIESAEIAAGTPQETPERPAAERPVIRRIPAPEVPVIPVVTETHEEIGEPEEDETQVTEHIHIVPSIGRSTVLEGEAISTSRKEKAEATGEEDGAAEDRVTKVPTSEAEADETDGVEAAEAETERSEEIEPSEDDPQATERIYFPAGFKSDKEPVAEDGVVHEGAYVPKPKPEKTDEETETETKEDLESTDAIEIRRVLSLAEAIVLEQSLRAQNPLAELTTTEIETILLDEIDEESVSKEDKEEDEEPTPWHARLAVSEGLQESLNRAGEAIKPTKDSFDRWIGYPFKPRALPSNFDTLIEPRKRSLLQEGRLEAETRGLVLTSAISFAMLWFIWLLLPANFLGILKNQVSGQLVYQLLQAGLVLLIPLMLFAKYHPFPLGRIFGPVMPSGSQNFTSALIGLPLGVLVVSLQNLSTTVMPHIYTSNLNRYMFMPQSLRPGSTVILWVIHIILPSFLEELFFRGNLFTGLMRQGHRRAAFILPSLLYALLFKDPLIFVPFLVGIALSWVRYRSASLFGSMIAHFSFVATIFFLYQNVPAFVRTMPLSSTAGQASLYASVVAAVVSAVTLVSLLAFVGTLQSPEQANEFSQQKSSSRSLFQLREVRIGGLIFILIYLLNLGLF